MSYEGHKTILKVSSPVGVRESVIPTEDRMTPQEAANPNADSAVPCDLQLAVDAADRRQHGFATVGHLKRLWLRVNEDYLFSAAVLSLIALIVYLVALYSPLE